MLTKKTLFLSRPVSLWLVSATAGMVLLIGLPVSLSGQSSEDFLGLPPIAGKTAPDENRTRKFAELSPAERKSLQEMMLVERFLSLPPERLAEVRNSIELIQQMSPEEKERIRQQIKKFRRMSSGEREKMHARWSAVSTERRNMMRSRFLSMSEEDRRAERDKLKSMTPEQRHQYFRETYGEPGDKSKMHPPPPPPPPLHSLSVSEPLSSVGDSTESKTANGEKAASSAAIDAEKEGE